tara:strand:+ start:328 stop:837 length:510 start_codon:yes stop_codon:yes gene_type:complete
MLILLGACTLEHPSGSSGIGFREARFAEIAEMRKFRECVKEGKKLDEIATRSGGFGAYLSSAKILEKCETEIGPNYTGVGVEERMQAYALAIQNYVKGRNIQSAKSSLTKFRLKFANKDFYYPDGTSFLQTMEVLIGTKDPMSFGHLSSLNVNKVLKSEMRRIEYWKNQ